MLNSEIFYSHYVGVYPFDTNKERIITQSMIDHLGESNVSQSEILRVFEHCAQDSLISPDNLPDFLWSDSITVRGKWYYHRELQIRNKDSVVDPINGIDIRYPYFVEMKTKYTYDNLFEYATRNLGSIYSKIAHSNKDIGVLKHLVKKYDSLDIASGLDFVLTMIDLSRDYNDVVNSIINIENRAKDSYETLASVVAEAKAHNANKIVWRFNAK